MLSHLKAREIAPVPAETGEKDTQSAAKSKIDADADQQAVDRLTCDALCSLASGTKKSSPEPSTPNPPMTTPAVSATHGSVASPPLGAHGFLYRSAVAPVAVPSQPAGTVTSPAKTSTPNTVGSSATSTAKTSTKMKSCPKQHQLPLFLSKTYHMIDRCDPEVATWSATGDNFVVKNVEKFASAILPLYFKHSNFSSFARQLNFYGFRKLRSDPILTNDVDPQTSCYVRFYHEKFQKDKPELLHSIKRATKSDQQSKDDVDDLKSQVSQLKKCVVEMSTEMERKITEINFEYNRRISGLTTEYDKLASLVAQLLQQQQNQNPAAFIQSSQQHLSPNHAHPHPTHQTHYITNPPLPPVVETTTPVPNTSTSISTSGNTTTTSSSSLSSTNTTSTSAPPSVGVTPTPSEQQQQHKMQSLSQVVAMSLMATASIPGAVMGAMGPTTATQAKAATIPATPADESKKAPKRKTPGSGGPSESLPPSAIRPKIN